MHFRKFISLWVLIALMLGQVALAHHSASHIEHEFSQEIVASNDIHDDHNHDHDHDNKKHECSECLLNKSLQTAYYNTPVVLSFSLRSEIVTSIKKIFTVSENHYNSNTPRAPPTILI